ncbi:hypothetical protein HGA08_02670 [Nocardia vermiculata]|uniref:Uncharacterized protein n=1 Tax=Nocardia vermiculata TaxID=257274 RepID=A0A846XPY5_9NOCA|nr:hypothetical protein [Nocardia vermiculata]
MSQDDSVGAGSSRTAWMATARIVAWVVFLGGLVGAVLGIAGLRVEITVVGLILAFTSGLVLLKLRADTNESA